MIILMHKIALDGPAGNENWNTPGELDAFIQKHHKRIVSLRDYVMNDFRGVVLTFDGIYENVHMYAWPVLKRHAVPFEMFVVWGTMGQGNEWDAKEPFARFASMEQLWAMSASGRGRIQSHSVNHPDLTSVSDEALRWEVANPFNCEFFGYPYGKHDARVVAAAKSTYKGGISVRAGADDDRWALNRVYLREAMAR